MTKSFFHVECPDHLKAETRKLAEAIDLTESQYVREAVRRLNDATKKELAKREKAAG